MPLPRTYFSPQLRQGSVPISDFSSLPEIELDFCQQRWGPGHGDGDHREHGTKCDPHAQIMPAPNPLFYHCFTAQMLQNPAGRCRGSDVCILHGAEHHPPAVSWGTLAHPPVQPPPPMGSTGGTQLLFPSPAGTLQPESGERGSDEVMLLNIAISSQPFSPATRSGCCRLGHCGAVPEA